MMKNIKTFEQFNESQSQAVNEEWFGLNKDKKRKRNIQEALDRYVPVWVRAGKISDPTEEDLDKFWSDAEADDYESGDVEGGPGGVGFDKEAKKIRYRKASEININYSNHVFGSGE